MRDVEIKADSLNIANGHRVTTILLTRFPYTLVQEIATHRLISQGGLDEWVIGPTNPFGPLTARSSASTRAIPVERLIQRVLEDPFVPTWSKNQKGMTGIENTDQEFQNKLTTIYRRQMHSAICEAREMAKLGAHKQHINDILKPFLRIPILVTSTEKGWENFFRLRTDKPCRPEFREYVINIKNEYDASKPKELQPGEIHIPFAEKMYENTDTKEKVKVAAARCARLSYASHDGNISKENDLRLADQLLADGHMGPFEHILIATSRVVDEKIVLLQSKKGNNLIKVHTRNFDGFYSYRAAIEDGIDMFED